MKLGLWKKTPCFSSKGKEYHQNSLEVLLLDIFDKLFQTEEYQRAICLETMESFGVPFQSTKFFNEMDEKMWTEIGNSSNNLVELEVGYDGVESVLVDANYLNAIYNCTLDEIISSIEDFTDGLLVLYVVNTDFFLKYREEIGSLNGSMWDKVKIILWDIGNDLNSFLNLDILRFLTNDYIILGEKVISVLQDFYKKNTKINSILAFDVLSDIMEWFRVRFHTQHLEVQLYSSLYYGYSLLEYMDMLMKYLLDNITLFSDCDSVSFLLYIDDDITDVLNILFTDEYIKQINRLSDKLTIDYVVYIEERQCSNSIYILKKVYVDRLVIKSISEWEGDKL